MRRVIRNVLFRIRLYITVLICTIASTPLIVHADLDGTWNVVVEAIFPFLTKLGILLILFGGIEFAISQSNEDAAQKTRAARFMAAGALTVAVIVTMKPYLMI